MPGAMHCGVKCGFTALSELSGTVCCGVYAVYTYVQSSSNQA